MPKQRIYGLDILRSLAIFAVLYSHSYFIIQSHVQREYYRIHPDGVSMFFVLSGFLIGGILLRTMPDKNITFGEIGRFWAARWFRTIPAYVVVLTFVLSLGYPAGPSFTQWIPYYFFSQSFTDGAAALFPESWSLCVEEYFYLCLPILLLCLRKIDKKQAVLFICLFVIVAVTLLRIYRIHHATIIAPSVWTRYIRRPTVLRLDSIMFGVLGAYLFYYKHTVWQYKNLLFGTGIALTFFPIVYNLAFGFDAFLSYTQLTLEAMGTLLLIPKLQGLKTGKGLIYKIVSFISLISYSMYLLNYTPFDRIVLPWLQQALHISAEHTVLNDGIRLLLFLLWTLAGSYVLYTLVEKPFLRLRDKLLKRKKQIIMQPRPLVGFVQEPGKRPHTKALHL